MEFTAVFQKVPEGYIGFVEELPGANTQGATLDEARANLAEAVGLVLEANRALHPAWHLAYWPPEDLPRSPDSGAVAVRRWLPRAKSPINVAAAAIPLRTAASSVPGY